MSQNSFGRLGQIRHGLAVSTLFALTVFTTLPPSPATAADAQPKRKDSNAFIKPKEVVLSASVEPAEAKAGDVVTYTVTAKVAPGWHIYQYKPNPKGESVRDTYFDFFDLAGLKSVGDWTAAKKPIRKAEPAFDNEILEFYENEARWSLKLQIPPGTAPGPKVLRDQIIFQICDANSCKPPARSTLPDVTLTVVPGVGGGSNGAASAAPTPPAETVEKTVAAEAAPTSEVAREAQKGLISLMLVSAGAGLLALVMPCVWPMIPITVNFFVKQGSKNKGKTTGLAVAYCLAIIGVFTSVGVLVSFFFSATALQNLANNPWLNTFVALLFLAFGLSLLGLFEVRLPNFLLNASAKGEGRGGMIGVMFMALTLTITSFTCTFPVVGGLIVMAANGEFFYPIVGLATFSSVLAFPFFLLALAPGLVSKMPKSGDWMNSVKVVGGLIEVGAALKFMNTAEIGFGAVPEDAWFDASLVLSAWVGIAAVCGLYLLGLFRTDHDHEEVKIGPGRLLIGSLFLALALFMAPALFGNPPKSPLWDLVVGILPADVGDLDRPTGTGGSVASEGMTKATSTDPATAEREEKRLHGVVWGMSYDAALEEAKASNKPILIDFTGVNCANCRTMEQTVLNRNEISGLLSEFVTVQLYTDYVPIGSLTQEQREALAEKNQLLQLGLTKEATNPFYVVLTPEGQLIQALGGYRKPFVFSEFLNGALTKNKSQDKAKVAQADPAH